MHSSTTMQPSDKHKSLFLRENQKDRHVQASRYANTQVNAVNAPLLHKYQILDFMLYRSEKSERRMTDAHLVIKVDSFMQ